MSHFPLEYLCHFDTLNFPLRIHVWMRFWLKKLVMPFSRYIAHEFISSPRVSQANFTPGGRSTKTMTRRLGRCGQQSRQGVKFLSTRTCLQKWQQTYSKIGGDLCWFLWLWIWLGETLENFLLWAFIFWNIWGETFFMPSVEKIKWVCNVPREAIKKERNLEFDLSLLSLWKSACQNDKGTPGDFGGTLTARKKDLPIKMSILNLKGGKITAYFTPPRGFWVSIIIHDIMT